MNTEEKIALGIVGFIALSLIGKGQPVYPPPLPCSMCTCDNFDID